MWDYDDVCLRLTFHIHTRFGIELVMTVARGGLGIKNVIQLALPTLIQSVGSLCRIQLLLFTQYQWYE
jgi:hypothetical protein